MANRARVGIAGPASEARRLALRLSRAGIPAIPDDGAVRIELMVALSAQDLGPLRARSLRLIAVGLPATPLYQAGADDVVPPGEPQVLFRRVRALIERADLEAREQRLAQRLHAMEEALAEVAHDLRSPLHAAIGHAELLASDASLDASQRGSAEASARQGNRALALAERILEGAGRPDQNTPQLRTVHLGALLEAAAAGAQAAAAARGVTVTALAPARTASLRADGELLARLLDNLVANAIRHTPKGGEVELSAERTSPRAVQLHVRDTGEGIAPAQLARLVAGVGGGRGLRICRQIVERHGGDLWAESSAGQGARFTVELPLQIPSLRPHVLLVSDDSHWIKDVSRVLKAACDITHQGTANAHLNGRHTDLVLVEVPPKGRARSLTNLRAQAKDAKVPVIDLPPNLGADQLARTLVKLTG